MITISQLWHTPVREYYRKIIVRNFGNNVRCMKVQSMDKLKLIGRNLGQVFDFRLGHACKNHAIEHVTKQPNLTLKTQPKQLLGSLPLALALPGYNDETSC